MLSAIYTVTVLYLQHRTGLCSDNAPHVCSSGAQFEPQTGHWLWTLFREFLHFRQANAATALLLGHSATFQILFNSPIIRTYTIRTDVRDGEQ
jgi:hypothetical protein